MKKTFLDELDQLERDAGGALAIASSSIPKLDQRRKKKQEERDFAEQIGLAIVLPVEFAAASPKGVKKPNCNPSKSHFCQSANGRGSCVPLTKKCKFTPTGTAKQAANATGKAANKAKAKTKATPAAAPAPTPTPVPTSAPATATSPVKTNATELDTKRNDLIQRFGQKTVEDAEKNVQKILNDADVFVRVGSADTLEKILDGGFKTSAELGIDTHQIPNLKGGYQQARNRVEAKTLGYDEKNTAPGDRPIYGYLGNGKDLNGQSHADVAAAYGSIAVKLKAEVKDRTTFTGSDSFKSGIASEVKNDGPPPPPNAASLVSSTRHGYDKDKLPAHYPDYLSDDSADGAQLRQAAGAKDIDDLAPKLAITGNAYVEAQVHGKVGASDIAELHFTPGGASDRPSPKIAQFAKDNGVDLYVNGKKLDKDELDNIITPPADRRSQRLKDLDDAITKGDLDTVVKLTDDLHDAAQQVKLNPGEHDRYLKLLYQESGFDGKPTVGTSADLDNAAKGGATMLARGLVRRSPNDTSYLDDFKNGDYFTGNGIYGNGTYVGHSGKIVNGRFVAGNSPADSKRAWDDVAKHSYINPNSLNFRMALPADATVITATEQAKEIRKMRTKIRNWSNKEQTRIQQAANNQAGNSPADLKKVQAEAARVQAAYASLGGTTTKTKKALGGGDYSAEYTLSFKGEPPFKYKIERNSNIFGTAVEFTYVAPDGRSSIYKKLKDAETAAQKDFYMQKAAKNLGYSQVPDPGGNTAAVKRQLQDFTDRVAKMEEVLFGDEGSGSSGRFGVIRGVDALALNKSYEPDTFMVLLNRSKTLVQDTELSYKVGRAKGVGV